MIDGHGHLDGALGTLEKAIAASRRDAEACGVEKVVLLNVPGKLFGNGVGFANEDVLNASRGDAFFAVFPEIDPRSPDAPARLVRYRNMGAVGLKLHPRLRQYSVSDFACVELVRAAGALNMPVTICAFPDGLSLKLGNNAEAFAQLAEAAGETRIAIGHAGGHRILDFLMIAKYFKNVWLDLSFTPLYYADCPPVIQNIAYAFKSLRGQRLFWGTDYPDRPYRVTVDMTNAFMDAANLPAGTRAAFLRDNALAFLDGPK